MACHSRALGFLRLPQLSVTSRRAIASKMSHEERTAADRREPGMHTVAVNDIQQLNLNVRLLKLQPRGDKPKFLPGQWLDVHIPGIRQAGGFTVTSTPDDLNTKYPYLELAIQYSPNNPPAAWLWQKEKKILARELQIQVGGSFVWPPPEVDTNQIQNVVLVAGGVGINPLISIMAHLIRHSDYQGQINLLYSARKGVSGNLSSILFMKRIHELFARDAPQKRYHYTVFCTDHTPPPPQDKRQKAIKQREKHTQVRSADLEFLGQHHSIEYRRFEAKDLEAALGPEEERAGVVAYVCGPPIMTDWAVAVLDRSKGMDQKRVLCEKWW